jgi:hypothetical protein
MDACQLSHLVQSTGRGAAQGIRPADARSLAGPFLLKEHMSELSQRTIAKVSGPAWESLRGQFMQISRLLLAVSPDADSELMTTYVKFTINTALQSAVFAAIWLKSSKRLIVGLALPEEYEAEELGPALPGTMYKGLTKYFVVERGSAVPKGIAGWATTAFRNVLSAAEIHVAAREELRRAA